MNPNNYYFTYRCQLNRETYWQRHYCATQEDINRIRAMITRSYGEVEEIDEELSQEELKVLYENQEA